MSDQGIRRNSAREGVAPRSAKPSWARTAFFWILLLIFFAIPVAGAEAYLRVVLGAGNPIIYYANASYRYAPMPNQHVKRRRGAEVTIDSAGLRGVRDWTAPADQHILFVGDSVTWAGTNVDDRDMFATLTCQHLTEQLKRDMLCGDAGVNAYGVDNMVNRLRYDGALGNADAIVVTLITEDTLRGLVDLRGLPFYGLEPHGPLRAIWEVTGILALKAANYLLHPRAFGREQDRADKDSLRVATESVGRLLDTLRAQQAAGRKVLLVFSPTEDEIKQADQMPLTQAVRRQLAASGLPYLDMTEVVTARYGADFFVDGVHLDRRGHTVYAEAIAQNLATLYRDAE